jgi:hypothetical protein
LETAIQATPFDSFGNVITLTSPDGHSQAMNWVTLISSDFTDIQVLASIDEPDTFILCVVALAACIGQIARKRSRGVERQAGAARVTLGGRTAVRVAAAGQS